MAMNIKNTISNLRRFENKSMKGGYQRDATHEAVQRHTLDLLAILSDKKIEEDTYTPQDSGKQNFRCSACKGTGYIDKWEDGSKKEYEHKVIEDCDICKGEGVVEIKVIDKRKKTKDKDLYYDDEF